MDGSWALGSLLNSFSPLLLSAVINIAQGNWKSLLLGPLTQFIISFFPGRSKIGFDSATDNAALVLLYSKNPVLRAWGAAIRLGEGQGCATSASGGVCRAYYDRVSAAAAADLARQFGNFKMPSGATVFAQYTALVNSRTCTDSSFPNQTCGAALQVFDQASFLNFVSRGWLTAAGAPTASNPYSVGAPKCNCA